MAKSKSDRSGCSVLIGIIGIIVLAVNTCGGRNESRLDSKDKTNSPQTNSYIQQQQGSINYQIDEELSEEDKKFLHNSLSTGATPYSQYYGNNYKCPYDQCSGIRVTAPHGSDILVIIKRNNQNGKVVAHGYICSGATYQFDLPDGTYQTFFYYGEGWNPNKVMKGEVKGGFIKDELFSKIIRKKFIVEYYLMSFSCKEMVIFRRRGVIEARFFNSEKTINTIVL